MLGVRPPRALACIAHEAGAVRVRHATADDPLRQRVRVDQEPSGLQRLAAEVIRSAVRDAETHPHPARRRMAAAWFGSLWCDYWCNVGGFNVRAVRTLAAQRLGARREHADPRDAPAPTAAASAAHLTRSRASG